MEEKILDTLNEIKVLLTEKNLQNKEILTANEASRYLGVVTSYLYKMTCYNLIPHYCPNGRKIYFKRTELDAWMLQNKSSSDNEIDEKAKQYLKTHKQ